MCKYTGLAKLAKVLHDGCGSNDDLRKQAIGLVCDGIHQAPPIPTGMVSIKGKDRNISALTKEHFFSRKLTARKIFDAFDKGRSIQYVTRLIMSRSRVHYVTKEENINLIKYQHNTSIRTWREEYRSAGIELVPYEKKSSKYMYKVGETVYNNPKDAANDLNVDAAVVVYRATSKSKKWSQWTREVRSR